MTHRKPICTLLVGFGAAVDEMNRVLVEATGHIEEVLDGLRHGVKGVDDTWPRADPLPGAAANKLDHRLDRVKCTPWIRAICDNIVGPQDPGAEAGPQSECSMNMDEH